MSDELLTDDELAAMDATVALCHAFVKIVSDGPSRTADINEFVVSIHHIQSSILSQAAYRAYPEKFRPLGGWPASAEDAKTETP